MKILLDTHVALWAIADTDKLNEQAIEILQNQNNEIYYSVVSIWEIAIKHQINPLNMPISEEEFVAFCESMGLIRLDIKPEHIYAVKTLFRKDDERKHNDPFDRLLLAQAKTDGYEFMTHDSLIVGYNESCVLKI